MGMRYFGVLTGLKLDIENHTPYTGVKPSASKAFLIPTAKEVTLAEYNAASGDAITAHRLADYRRRKFSLVLLPDVHILLERLLDCGEGTDVSLQM